jgi:hypothetical protein
VLEELKPAFLCLAMVKVVENAAEFTGRGSLNHDGDRADITVPNACRFVPPAHG